MSRATHDIECLKENGGCGFIGKVPDDVITCPKCGRSVEGQPVSPEVLKAIIERIESKRNLEIGPERK